MTNADKIRSLTDDELAEFLHSIVRDWGEGASHITSNIFQDDSYVENWWDWLKQEAKKNDKR